MSNPRYFRLDAHCFLTPGVRRGVVHNLDTGEAMWLDEASTKALLRSEANEPFEEPPELFHTLEQRGWGFFADAPVFVDKLRTFNIFREKRLWKETPYLGLAVLQLTNECVRRCATCASAFCPVCKVFDEGAAPLTFDEWVAVLDDAALFGAPQVLMTGGEALLHPDVVRIAAAAAARGIGVQIHTSGLVAPPAALPPVAFSILVRDAGEIDGIVERFGDRRGVSLLLEEIDPAPVAGRVPEHWLVRRVSPAAPRITKQQLATTPFERFFARKMTDNCLNGKIYVAYDGRVFPCFGRGAVQAGDVRAKDGFAAAIRALVDGYWTVPAERVDVNRACTLCEFRYCCTACRFVDPAAQCSYDIETSVWT